MVKLKKNLINYKIEIVGTLILVLLAYGLVLFPHYSQDTYMKLYLYSNMSIEEYIKSMSDIVGAGRFFYAIMLIITKIMFNSGVVYNIFVNILNLIMFFILIFSTYIMLNRSHCNKNEKILNYIISSTIYITPLFVDWIIFPECTPYYLFGILLVFLSIKFFWNHKNKNINIILSLLFLILGVGIYQPVIAYFILLFGLNLWINFLDSLYSDKLSNVMKNSFFDILKAVILCLIAVSIQLCIIKLFNNTHRASNDIVYNIKNVVNSQKSFWLMQNVGDKTYIYILSFLIIVILFVHSVYTLKLELKKKSIVIIFSVLFFVIWYISIFFTHIFIEPWISQRTIPTFFAGISVCSFMTISIYKKSNYSKKSFLFLSIGVILSILIINNIYKSNSLQIDLFKVNALDREISSLVEQEIEVYETRNNIQVTKIAIATDVNTTWTYQDVFCSYDMNIRAWAKDWSAVGALYFYTGRYLELTSMKETIYDKYFKNKDWHNFSKEQLYFEGDTLNIILY